MLKQIETERANLRAVFQVDARPSRVDNSIRLLTLRASRNHVHLLTPRRLLAKRIAPSRPELRPTATNTCCLADFSAAAATAAAFERKDNPNRLFIIPHSASAFSSNLLPLLICHRDPANEPMKPAERPISWKHAGLLETTDGWRDSGQIVDH